VAVVEGAAGVQGVELAGAEPAPHEQRVAERKGRFLGLEEYVESRAADAFRSARKIRVGDGRRPVLGGARSG
jgi:hypothetical protein